MRDSRERGAGTQTAEPGQGLHICDSERGRSVGQGTGDRGWTGGRDRVREGWVAGRAPTCVPERLHLWGLLAALASEPVHVLGSRSHHLVRLQLTFAPRAVHLQGRAGRAVRPWGVLWASRNGPATEDLLVQSPGDFAVGKRSAGHPQAPSLFLLPFGALFIPKDEAKWSHHLR